MTEKKVVIVTGAARGIGRAATDLFLADGWNVVMIDRLGELLETEARKLQNTFALKADVSNPQDANRIMTEAVREFGRVDCLVNNAGVADFGLLEEHDFARWRRVMETNLDGVFSALKPQFLI